MLVVLFCLPYGGVPPCCAAQQTRVRFSSLKEVRFLPDEEADDAEDSRRSFGATHSIVGRLWKQKKLTVKQVMLLSFLLSFVVSMTQIGLDCYLI